MIRTTIAICIFFFSMTATLKADQPNCQEGFNRGYLFSKLEERFPCSQIEFDVQDSQLIVYQWDTNLSCELIKLYLEEIQDFPVVFDRSYRPDKCTRSTCKFCYQNIEEGGFLPELNPFFTTMLAQPHIIGYSAGYRCYDRVFRTDCLPVSIGDQFSLFQIKALSPHQLYFGIEVCVWAIFEAKPKSLSLINADYFVALPLTYINDRFSAKLRLFHQSSHLGDEFLLENRCIKRVNPSMEVIDLALAYNFSDQFTAFIGYSRVLRSDESFRVKPNGLYYGFNYYLNFFKLHLCNVEAVPYFAAYFNNLENNKWKTESNVAIGYQWDKLYGHKLRAFIAGHIGHSEEGQFQRKRTRYVEFKLLYGY